jgi:glyceraldehyde 3-phosphate dehydrogenase
MQEVLMQQEVNSSLKKWREKEKKALELLQVVGELRFDKAVELVLFRKDLYDSRPSQVINDHLYAKNYVNKPISIEMSLSLAKVIASLPLAPARIDIGKLALNWHLEEGYTADLSKFVRKELDGFIGDDKERIQPKDVVLYGFGRIGRLLTRRLVAQTGRGEQLRLKAIVLRPKFENRLEELQKRANLLKTDSVHGQFQGTVVVSPDGTELIINGNRIKFIYASHPSDIDYTEYGINEAIVLDNTGVWRTKDELAVHLRPGVAQVMLTAPGKNVPNIVHGVNHTEFDLTEENIFSAASCTTNAIVPIIKLINDTYTIKSGHIESIHSYTSSQNLLDNFHKKPRRGRAAAVNMVLTTTGAGTATGIVLPEMAGKLTANAVRIPTPNVSLAILNLELADETTIEAINQTVKSASIAGDLMEQIMYSDNIDFVSSDVIGTTTPSVFDAPSTLISQDGKRITLYVWYDNEYGYSCQVVRLAKYAAKVIRHTYY